MAKFAGPQHRPRMDSEMLRREPQPQVHAAVELQNQLRHHPLQIRSYWNVTVPVCITSPIRAIVALSPDAVEVTRRSNRIVPLGGSPVPT